jgi:hypothetical protein
MARLRSSDLKLGRSDQFLVPFGDMPQEQHESLAEARRRILAEGWRFRDRPGLTEHGRKFTMTLRKIIWLVDGFNSYPVWKQASILWHELVHVYQRKSWGHSKFLGRYTTARGRWAIETPGYRMSVRAYERLSGGRFHATNYIESKLVSMRKNYWLGWLDQRQYTEETRAIWYTERRK